MLVFLTSYINKTCELLLNGDEYLNLLRLRDQFFIIFLLTGQCCTVLDHPNFVSCGKFHPVMPYIVATGTNESIQVWDIRSPEVPCRTFTYKEHLGQVYCSLVKKKF